MFRKFTLLSVLAILGAMLAAAPVSASARSTAKPGLTQVPIKPLRRAFATPSPTEVEFGAVDVDGSGSRQIVRLENTFPKPVEEKIRSVAIVGKRASDFTIVSDGCSGVILYRAPESCTVEVSFTPGAAAANSATLELVAEEVEEEGEEEGEVEEEVEVPLSGEGVIGTLSASPSPVSFSPIPYTASNAEGEGGQNETLQTTILSSKAATQVEEVSITGEDASSFSVAYGDCEHNVLHSSETCDEGIRFQPLSPGAKHAQLVITSDSASSPLVVPLEGEGLYGPQITLSSTEALLGEVLLGSSVTQTFTATNTGDYPLGIQEAVVVSGTPQMFPVLSDTCSGETLRPGNTCAVTLAFLPTTTGEKNASILFVTDSALPLHVVGIDGVGVQPAQPAVSSPGSGTPFQVTLINTSASPSSSPATADAISVGPKLTVQGPPGSFTAHARMVDPGIRALCPPGSGECEVETFITTSFGAPGSTGGSNRGLHLTVLLGSGTERISSGTSTQVHIHLSRAGYALLEQHGRLRVRMGVTLRDGRQTTITRTGMVTLVR